MVTRVFVNEDWSTVIEGEDYLALTADQLRALIEAEGNEVIRFPDGTYDLYPLELGGRIELNYDSSVEVTAPLETVVLTIVEDFLSEPKCKDVDSVFTHEGVRYLLTYDAHAGKIRVDIEPWDTDTNSNAQPTHPATGRAR